MEYVLIGLCGGLLSSTITAVAIFAVLAWKYEIKYRR